MRVSNVIALLSAVASLSMAILAFLFAYANLHSEVDRWVNPPEICRSSLNSVKRSEEVRNLCAYIVEEQRGAIVAAQDAEQRHRTILGHALRTIMIWGTLSSIAFLYILLSNRRGFGARQTQE